MSLERCSGTDSATPPCSMPRPMRGCCSRSRSLGSEDLGNDDQRACRAVCHDLAKARLPVQDQRTHPVELRALRRGPRRGMDSFRDRSGVGSDSALAAPHRPQTAYRACRCVLDAGRGLTPRDAAPRCLRSPVLPQTAAASGLGLGHLLNLSLNRGIPCGLIGRPGSGILS